MDPKGEILVVDDTPESLKLLVDLLMDEGYRVRPTMDPKLALESALSNPPELILLDVRMPGMDGFELFDAGGVNHQLDRQEAAIAAIADVDAGFVEIGRVTPDDFHHHAGEVVSSSADDLDRVVGAGKLDFRGFGVFAHDSG